MQTPTFFKRFQSLAEAAAFLGVLFTLAGLLGRFVWFLEICTHFKLQLACCFVFYAVLEFAARRHRRAAASIAFAAVNAFPVILLLLPASSGASMHPLLQNSSRLRILQANILTCNTNAPALLALVAHENPDVIVLQEPNTRWLNALSSLTNNYPIHAEQLREDNFGAAIFCKSNALSADILLLNDPERAPSSRARISVRGKTITIIGTHTLAPYNEYMWRGRNSFTLELARSLRKIEGPVVVTGDFNNTPWSAHFLNFLTTSGLHDSAQGRGPLLTWPTTCSPLIRIPLDHCFHSDGVRILDRRLGPDIGSDHLPLVIDIAF